MDNAQPSHRAKVTTDDLQEVALQSTWSPANRAGPISAAHHLRDHLTRARQTNKTMLANLGQILLETLDGVPRKHATWLVGKRRGGCCRVFQPLPIFPFFSPIVFFFLQNSVNTNGKIA